MIFNLLGSEPICGNKKVCSTFTFCGIRYLVKDEMEYEKDVIRTFPQTSLKLFYIFLNVVPEELRHLLHSWLNH